MSWTRQGATRWRRPLDCHDRLFQSIAAAGKPLGREHWLVVGAARLGFQQGPDRVVERLRSAWASLRLRHPDIALELGDEGKYYEQLASAEALEAWVDNTFFVEEGASSVDELFFGTLKVGAASATCHWVPSSGELAIVSSHWRWDGIGTMLLLHEFLTGLAAPGAQSTTIGNEGPNLVPSLDVVVGFPETIQVAWMRRAEELLAPFEEGLPSVGLPVTNAVLPGDGWRLETVVSPRTLAAALVACRTRRIRLAAALHASIIVQTVRHQTSESRSGAADAQYKSWAVFDLRKYCPAPFDGPIHAPSLRLLGLPIAVESSSSWDTLAAALQAVYEQSFEPAAGDLMFARVPLVEKATKMLAQASPTTEPNLSNLGVLDKFVQSQYGDVEVHNLWEGVQMLTPQLYIHTWSWKGALHISVCYNKAFYEGGFVQMWLQGLKDTLLTNLGVGNAAEEG